MKTRDSGKNKHLTFEQRKEIKASLNHGITFKTIGRRIGKDPTTVSYEVKHHRKEHRSQFVQRENGCPIVLKVPFVCNGCPKRQSKSCPFVRLPYRVAEVREEYKVLLTEAREGITLNEKSFYENDRIITAGLHAGQRSVQE